MSSQLAKQESPGRALQRACRRHVAHALAGLKQDAQPKGAYEVRKHIKRVRAILQLTRGSLRRHSYRKTARVMRLAAKALAAPRDARVIQRAFASLVGNKTRRFPHLQTALEAHVRKAERSFQHQDSAALAQFLLKTARRQFKRVEFDRTDWTKTLKRSYTQGRKAYELARRKPAPAHFHAWRKQVKKLYYQLDFLCPAWPASTNTLLKDLEQLGEQLGQDHDLVLLDQFVREQRAHGQETEALQHLITSKSRLFGKRILQIGSRLYAKTPKAVHAQMKQDWKAWQGKQKPAGMPDAAAHSTRSS